MIVPAGAVRCRRPLPGEPAMPLLTLATIMLTAAAMPPLRAAAGPIDSNWAVVDRTREGDCGLTVTGNGKIYLITVTGMDANAPARYLVRNGDMKPVNWRVTSDSTGSFARYYMPFRWHRDGGTVTVSVSSDSCAISSSFAWRKAGTEAN